jgi:hypothetical protein
VKGFPVTIALHDPVSASADMDAPARSPEEARKVLLVTQLPSDFTEMSRVAEALHRRGHAVYFVHHPARHDQLDVDPVVRRLRELKASGDIADFELIYETPARVAVPPVPAPTSQKKDDEERWPQRFQRSIRNWVESKRDGWFCPKPLVPATEWFFATLMAAPVTIDRWHKNTHRFVMRWGYYEPRAWYVEKRYKTSEWLKEQLAGPRYVVALLKLYAKRYRAYRDVLARHDIQCIVLPEDCVGMVSPLLIKAARRRNIGTVILPYTIANQQEAFRSLSVHEDYQMRDWGNRLVGWIFRKWRMRDECHDIVRLPGAHILAHEWLRMTPPDPWMMNSGYADVVAIESEAMRDYYKAAGIAEDRLSVVGAIYDDSLFAARQRREVKLADLRDEIGLSSEKPLLVVGGCPDQLSSCPGCDFKSMSEAVAFMAETLKPMRAHYDVVVRPHPNYLQFADEFRRHGIPSTTIDTLDLVAAADAYVAFASATIRWSIACGIPTINYDLFQYNYDDFKSVPGVANVRTKAEFRAAVEALRPDGAAYAEQSANIRSSSRRWSMFDGRCADRIEGLIERYSRQAA